MISGGHSTDIKMVHGGYYKSIIRVLQGYEKGIGIVLECAFDRCPKGVRSVQENGIGCVLEL